MIDNKYWKERAIQLEKKTHQSSKKSYQELIPVFNKAQKEIQNKIDLWLTRIADNNEVSLDKAKEMLDKKELKDFKMSLTEYINFGMDNALNQRWMKELENASARVHIDRLEQLKINLQAEAMRLFGTEDKILKDSIKETYNERYDLNNYIVQKGLGIGFDVASVDQEKLDKYLSKPWVSDGRNFSNRLWQSKEQMVNNLYNQTVRLSLGGNLKDAIDSMTRYVSREIKNKKYAAQRLIQTEMSYFTAEAQKLSYNELGLEKYEIVATLDNKTSSICQEMDGKVFDMKAYQAGVTAPPFHPNCRSTTCPYFDDEFTIGEMRKAKDLEGKTYKVPATMNYMEWKAKQEETKEDVIIPKDYNANEHKKEIEHANLIQKEFGGRIEMLVENGKTVTADMIWNDKLWEIKAVTSETSIDNAIRHGLKQIAVNPGGIILNTDKCKLSNGDIENCIKDRLNRSKIDIQNLDVILVKDKTIYQQLKIQKEEMSTSTKTGANSISSHKNNITKTNKSQFTNDTKIRGSYSHQQGVKGTSYINNVTTEPTKSQLKNSKNNDKISRVIGGALDKFSKEADEHAKTYYESIRNRKDDDYLKVIAEKSKIDIKDIKIIKDYIFNDKHHLKTGYKRFDEDYEMAESWQRLSDKNMNALPQDIIMLKHELLERQYEEEGYEHTEAHVKANEQYNYEDYYK